MLRAAARQGETVDSATSHIGFRCVVRDQASRPGRRRWRYHMSRPLARGCDLSRPQRLTPGE